MLFAEIIAETRMGPELLDVAASGKYSYLCGLRVKNWLYLHWYAISSCTLFMFYFWGVRDREVRLEEEQLILAGPGERRTSLCLPETRGGVKVRLRVLNCG